MQPRLVVTQEFHKKQKLEDEPPLIDLHSSSTIPLTAGDGPLGNLQVDPRIQARKEMRLNEIQNWLLEEMDTSRKLNNDMTDNEAELRRDFKLEVILAQRERCMKKKEMLNQMMAETAKTKGKLYGENPAAEWVLEFRTKWETCGGSELDEKVNEEYTVQAERLQKAIESEDMWKGAWLQVVEPPRETPPPNAPQPK